MKIIENYLSLKGKIANELKFWLKKETSTPTGVVNPFYQGDYSAKYQCYSSWLNYTCPIFFFEWSDINGSKRIFTKVKSFYEFLEECNIEFPDYQTRTKMGQNTINYIACIKGKKTIVVSDSKEGLAKELEEAAKQPTNTYSTNHSYQDNWD